MAAKCKCGCGKDLDAKDVTAGRDYIWGHKMKGGAKAARPTDRPTDRHLRSKRAPRGSGFGDTIAKLREQRDAIDKAIAALEGVG